MNYTIGILKESAGESRVSMVPDTIKEIVDKFQLKVVVESGAGNGAGFNDEEYETAGAQIHSRAEVIKESTLLVCIHSFEGLDNVQIKKTLLCFSNPLFHFNQLLPLLNSKLTLYSLDLIPRTSKAQSMDLLSSMASLSGYKAVIKGAELFNSVLPMFTTAAGTIRPAKVLILGAGVAGLQAIATAKRLGAIVSAFDVRTASGEEVRSLGAKFIEVEGAAENISSGGYAVEQSDEYIRLQKELIDKHIAESSIVISTANIPGKPAPRLIERASVEKMKRGSVIIDLAADQGGNCELTKNGEIVNHNGILILGNSFLVRETSFTASQLLSTNYFNFLKHLLEIEKDEIKNDPIVEGCLVIQEGEIVNDRVKAQIN